MNRVETSLSHHSNVHEIARARFPASSIKRAREITDTSFSFTSVRHPFRRLVSSYCNKVIESKEKILMLQHEAMLAYRHIDTLDIIRKYLPHHQYATPDGSQHENSSLKSTRLNILSTPGKKDFMEKSDGAETKVLLPGVPSFREFVVFIAVRILSCSGDYACLSELDTHYRPQLTRCNPCAWHFDFILKLETLSEDLSWMQRVLMSSSRRPAETPSVVEQQQVPTVNPSGSQCDDYEQYMHQLTSVEIDLMYTAYYHDFRFFDYEPFSCISRNCSKELK
ncbi:uncharacterized protein LOC108678193 isoform X2 [Hyalella azteca]|nr:uncharacterized protein LOC108678193 isoform X2 [Hyalella azteca]